MMGSEGDRPLIAHHTRVCVHGLTTFLYGPQLTMPHGKEERLWIPFDTENEKGVRISPRAVVGIAIGLIVVVMLLQVFVPLN